MLTCPLAAGKVLCSVKDDMTQVTDSYSENKLCLWAACVQWVQPCVTVLFVFKTPAFDAAEDFTGGRNRAVHAYLHEVNAV